MDNIEIDINGLTDIIKQSYSTGSTLLGSQLGSLLAPRIRPHKFAEYGGMRNFIEQNLSTVVEWQDRTNDYPGDDIYTVIHADSIDSWIDATSSQGKGLWNAYSNPNHPGRLALSDDGERLLYTANSRLSLPDGYRELEKVSEEDYLSLAKTYASTLDPDQQVTANEILSSDSFNSRWIAFLRNDLGGAHLKDWESRRVKWVIEKFKRDLKINQCSETRIDELTDALLSSKASAPASSIQVRTFAKSQKTYKRTPYGIKRPSGINSQDDIDTLRQLAHKIVDSMTKEELESIHASMGSILKALK